MRDAFFLTLAVTLVISVVAFTTGCGREAGTDAATGEMGGPAGPGGPGGPAPQDQPDAAQTFAHLDKNQDGKLTKDELPERIADKIMAADTDGDGTVTQAELEAAREKTGGPGGQAGVEAQGGPEAEGGAKPEGGPKPQAGAKSEDSPKAKTAAKPEDSPKPPKPQAAAKPQAGTKPQGRAEARGGPGGQGRPDAAQSFQQLDKNQDGKLTKDELPERMAERMMAADTNGDGAITKAEFEAAGERMGGQRGPFAQGGRGGGVRRPDPAQWFASLDKNQDGKLTKDELPERMAERMMAADTNGDGAITKAEFEAARETRGGERGQRGERGGNN